MPARPLVKLATDACIANLRHLFDVGDAPYEIVRPVLLKLGNPQQLREIERASPQICGADAEIWRGFIRRDIPDWESKPHEPKNPKNWYKVYRKLKSEADEQSTARAAALKAQLNQLSAEKESQHITFDATLTIPGRRRAPAQQQRPSTRPNDTNVLTFRSGSRTKTATGKSILQKARREAREARHFGSGGSALATPTHRLAAIPPPQQGKDRRFSAPSAGPVAAAAAPAPAPATDRDKESVQASRKEAALRRERALAQQRVVESAPSPPNPPTRRVPTNVFMPNKKRKV